MRPFSNAAVSEPAAGGFGALTIPVWLGVVEGVGNESSGTEFVVGYVPAFGEVLFGLPNTLLIGCGILTGPETAPGPFA